MCALHIGFATSHTVQDMINNAFINKQTSIEVSSEGRVLVQNDWVALERDVTLRLFKPSDFFSSMVNECLTQDVPKLMSPCCFVWDNL